MIPKSIQIASVSGRRHNSGRHRLVGFLSHESTPRERIQGFAQASQRPSHLCAADGRLARLRRELTLAGNELKRTSADIRRYKSSENFCRLTSPLRISRLPFALAPFPSVGEDILINKNLSPEGVQIAVKVTAHEWRLEENLLNTGEISGVKLSLFIHTTEVK